MENVNNWYSSLTFELKRSLGIIPDQVFRPDRRPIEVNFNINNLNNQQDPMEYL